MAFDARRLLDGIRGRPGGELAGLAAACVAGGGPCFEYAGGRRRIAGAAGEGDLPVEPDTRFRVASISKIFTTLTFLALREGGFLELDRDLSEYLGFPLRNPHFPDRPITAAMILSHVSSIRDIEDYNLPLGRRLAEYFEAGSPVWAGGGHWAGPEAGVDRGPGTTYSYCNLGFGLLAQAMEGVTARRFDRLFADLVAAPLGVGASFNVHDFGAAELARLATLYRRRDAEGGWDPEGPWRPQFDDFGGRRPRSPCLLPPGLGPEALEDYVPGTNGSLFSPQGGLRASIRDLEALLLFLLGAGSGPVSAESLGLMRKARWLRGAPVAAEDEDFCPEASGLGLMRDRNWVEGEWGHHADAYGLRGELWTDPDRGLGYAFLVSGFSVDPEVMTGTWRGRSSVEEEIRSVLLAELGRH